MPRKKRFGRRFKGLKHAKKKVPQSKDDPSNPPFSPGQTPTEDNPKDPPHPTKEPNLSINLDSGSNVANPQMNEVKLVQMSVQVALMVVVTQPTIE